MKLLLLKSCFDKNLSRNVREQEKGCNSLVGKSCSSKGEECEREIYQSCVLRIRFNPP